MAVLIALHILAAVVWVGGMFFAYVVLRQSTRRLAREARLQLWRRVFARFFLWVWASIILLLATGYGMIFFYLGGFAGAPLYIHVMQGIGIVMVLLYLHLYFARWRPFSGDVKAQRFPRAAKNLEQIRLIVAVNLALGLITVVVGASGRFW